MPFKNCYDGKTNDGRYWMGAWQLVTQANLKKALETSNSNGLLVYSYPFDWDGDGQIDQTFTVYIDAKNIALQNASGNIQCKTEDGKFVIYDGKMAIDEATVTVANADDLVVSEATLDPEITVMLNGTEVSSADYDLEYYLDGVQIAASELNQYAGDYVVKAVAKNTSANYSGTAIGALTVQKAASNAITAPEVNAVYDGQPHAIVATTKVEGSSLTYSDTEDGAYSEEAPSLTDVGTREVWVKATNPNYTDVKCKTSITVTRSSSLKLTASDDEYAYDGKEHALTVTPGVDGIAVKFYNEKTGEYDLDKAPTYTNAGTYTIKYKGTDPKGNYVDATDEASLTINPVKSGSDDIDKNATAMAVGDVFATKSADGNIVKLSAKQVDEKRNAELAETYKTSVTDYFNAFDVKLNVVNASTGAVVESLTENFGTVTLTLPIGAEYNGRTANVTELHKNADGTTEAIEFAPKVADGAIEIDVTKLSEIVVAIDDAATSGVTPMFRLYNPNSGEHFYTASEYERGYLIGIGWNDEGVGWAAPTLSNTPVYRVYNANGGEHHYTTSAEERKMLVLEGWKDEGIGWYSDDAETAPLYRQYNPSQFSCNHNYTTSADERDYLVSLGWKDEGIGWYGVA